MNVLIVFAHPEAMSFNGAMMNTAIEVLKSSGHSVCTSDLYRMKFKAVGDQDDFTQLEHPEHFNYLFEQKAAAGKGTFSKDILEEQEKLKWANYVIFQFPLWWTEPPAILKGWFDRVFAKGFAYDNGAIYENGLLKGKSAMLAMTMAGGTDIYGKSKLKGEIHERLFNWHHEKLYYCGFKILAPFIAWGVYEGDEVRERYLRAYSKRIAGLLDEGAISPRDPWLDENN